MGGHDCKTCRIKRAADEMQRAGKVKDAQAMVIEKCVKCESHPMYGTFSQINRLSVKFGGQPVDFRDNWEPDTHAS